jgi:hypothetical protein
MRTPYLAIAKVNCLVLFTEAITVFSEKHSKTKVQNEDLLIIKARGIYSYH